MSFDCIPRRFREFIISCGIPNNMQVSCHQQISSQATTKSPSTISHIADTCLIKDVWSSDDGESMFSLYLFDMTDKNIFDHFHDILVRATKNGYFSYIWSIWSILRLNGPHGNPFWWFNLFPYFKLHPECVKNMLLMEVLIDQNLYFIIRAAKL